MAKLRGQRMVLCSLLRECMPVIDALMQMPGDDDSDAHLNGLAGRITGALNALTEERVKGGESWQTDRTPEMTRAVGSIDLLCR